MDKKWEQEAYGDFTQTWKKSYKNLNSQIAPGDRLLRDTITKAKRLEQKHAGKGRVLLYKTAAATATVCICLYAAMPVLASSSDSIYQMMYLVSPKIAQYFMPVQLSDVVNGIKMEVVSASVRGKTVQVYLTMQDLEGDRIDETIDLYDSYNINLSFDGWCNCELAGYDESTKTATFLITIEQYENQKIDGDKITFTVGKFLSGKKTYEQVPIPVQLPADTTVQEVEVNGLGIADEKWMDTLYNADHLTALVPKAQVQQPLVDGIDLTGIGYIDGNLHIQMAVKDVLENDNHGFFYFKDHAGNKINSAYSFSFIDQAAQGTQTNYRNEVFEIDKEAFSEYELFGDFVITGNKTDGKWQVTFPVEKGE